MTFVSFLSFIVKPTMTFLNLTIVEPAIWSICLLTSWIQFGYHRGTICSYRLGVSHERPMAASSAVCVGDLVRTYGPLQEATIIWVAYSHLLQVLMFFGGSMGLPGDSDHMILTEKSSFSKGSTEGTWRHSSS